MRQAHHHGAGRRNRRGSALKRLQMASFTTIGDYAVVYDRSDSAAMPRRQDVPRHTHEDFDELVFTMKGSGIHVADDDEYPLVRGDVYVLRGAHMHGFNFRRDLSLMNILYRRSRFKELMPAFAGLPGFHELFVHEPHTRARRKFTSRLRLDARQMDEVASFINAIRQELGHPRQGSDIIIESLFKVLVTRVCQYYTQAAERPARADARVVAAIAFIERNFAGHVSIPALARAAAMPRSTLLRVFKKVTGSSPIDYLIHLRIKHATDMLASQDVHVIDVAMRCGFENIGYFNRKFKAIMGVTPTRYVKLHRAPLS